MTMVNSNFDIDSIENADVYDSEGAKVGSVGQVYVDSQTQEPEFVTVNIGLFGAKETFIPFGATDYSPEGLRVPFTKAYIKDAPNIDVDGHLSVEEEQRLWDYYSPDRGTGRQGTDAGGPGLDTTAADADKMVAHEERLKVGTEQREAGQVRLRKRVRTENQSIEVPVQREELVVERETVDPNSAEARSAGTIDDAGRQDEVVTLREERPVVDKETVATEKVNVGKRTVQDTETVSGEVRKEEIDVEGDAEPGAKR
ncbi:PRC and DUF2382 domain-containing protein [Nesterenkonia sp. LB17]|uniref:DUF2382 domain-containing protein n=1 Tax=unclassified Nesterenkonia TaxID=2629769 RepID=UPI001F4C78D5|nr:MULTISPECIES: PRC and DUF2382 domain-containing protein [unclassified Nesterenkonia]MCH8562746.1 PRC and DUF2382 domain-containing protein [Nesterenkonia sp. YGD6]MCH8565795.1 PRC and DUF2382 domain-containing protein [Nesterenkonia sp. LB17]